MLTTSYPVTPGIVSGSFVRDLLRGLAARDWEFEVVTPALHGAGAGAPEPGIRVHASAYPGSGWRGGLAHRHGMPEALAAEPWKWTLTPGLLLAMGRKAARRLEARPGGRGFDLLWSHWMLPGGALGASLARRYRVPHAVTAHGGDVHRLERLTVIPGARAALGRLWRDATISAPAERTADRVERALGRRGVRVLPLPAGSAAPAGKTGRGSPGVHLLFLGRFEPIKGPDLLLEACALLPAGRVAVVTFAGSGSLEPRLRARAGALAHRVEFAGVLDAEAKRAALERADLVVLPSRRLRDGRGEGLPHAATEALAAGTPVLAPAGDALGDLVERTGAGITFDAGGGDALRTPALARALEEVAASPARLRPLAERARDAGAGFAAGRTVPAWDEFLAACARRSA